MEGTYDFKYQSLQLLLTIIFSCFLLLVFIGCRRRTGRTVHEEAHVIVVAEEGTQTFGVGVSDNTPLRGNLSLIYEDTVDINLPETTGNTQQRSVSDHEAAEVFLQDVQTWEQLLTRYPDSSLSQSIRVLVQQAAAAEASQGDGQRESNVKFLWGRWVIKYVCGVEWSCHQHLIVSQMNWHGETSDPLMLGETKYVHKAMLVVITDSNYLKSD